MFEPLKEILNKHGNKLQDKLESILNHLAAIAENTQSEVVRSQRVFRSVLSPAVGEGEGVEPIPRELRNDSNRGWIIRWVSVSAQHMVWLGVKSNEGFLWEAASSWVAEEVNWYLPPGGVLIVECGEPGAENSINFQIEELATSTRAPRTGSSNEHIGVMRREPVPSGTPLDTPIADDPPPAARV